MTGTIYSPHKAGKTLHAHELVYQTAKEMAAALYDQVMSNNEVYEHWKKSYSNEFEEFKGEAAQARFVELMAPKLLGQARSTLARMLDPRSGLALDPARKDEIFRALIADHSLARGRVPKKRLRFKV